METRSKQLNNQESRKASNLTKKKDREKEKDEEKLTGRQIDRQADRNTVRKKDIKTCQCPPFGAAMIEACQMELGASLEWE